MTQTPAGWYPDPDPSAPQGSTRYWDGQRWTEQVHRQQQGGQQQYAAQQQYGTQQPGAPAYPQQGGQQNPYGAQQQNPYGAQSNPQGAPPMQQPYGQGGYAPAAATTPDGAPLAGWGARLGAWLIDGVVLFVLQMLVAIPWLGQITDAFGDYFNDTMDAASNGTPAPTQADLLESVAGPMLWVTLLGLLASAVYVIGMLAWRQQTLGKMALGLKVRLRAEDRLPIGAIAIRWGILYALSLLANLLQYVDPLLGILGTLVSVFVLIDGLWPLWDKNKQALHDKAAKTNVVRVR